MTESGSKRGRRRRSRPGRADWRTRAHDEAMAAAGDEAPAPIVDHPLVSAEPPILVEDDAGLAEAMEAVRAAGLFAYDTEFIGEETYVPRICLVQLATAEQVWIVDPLAEVDLGPIWNALADPDLLTVVHAGQQDLEPVLRHTEGVPAAIVDTQIAVGFLDLPYPLSLAAVIEQFLGVRLGKGMTFTRWDRRPMSRQHLRYAADDVRYLVAAWTEIQSRLEAAGHAERARAECDAAAHPDRFGFDIDRRTERIIGTRNLRPRQVAMVRAVLELRDEIARAQDVPPRSLMKDDVALRLSREMPADRAALERVKGLPWPVVESHGERILATVAELKERDAADLPPRVTEDESVADRVAIDTLWSVVQVLCRSHGIDPGLAAGRKELARFWAARRGHGLHRPHGLESGWRAELVGAPLTELLDGGALPGVTWTSDVLRPAGD